MWLIFVAVVLGIVEGLTEFVPVSSTGHMIIVGDLLGFTGKRAECFEVVIQLGAILAVVIIYWERFLGLFTFKTAEGTPVTGFRGKREWMLLLVTSIPAIILGKLIHGYMKEHLFHPIPVTIALAVGAIFILFAEKFRPKSDTDSLDGISWKQALVVGLFQCLSLWPGMSRSASTIIGGMFAKLDRKVAAEYSFLAAVPIMFVASAYDLYKTRDDLCRDDIPLFTVGFIVAMIVAGIAVKTFIKLLQHWTLVPFAVYRLIFAGVFGALVWTGIVQLTGK